jgi:hypothetical protein
MSNTYSYTTTVDTRLWDNKTKAWIWVPVQVAIDLEVLAYRLAIKAIGSKRQRSTLAGAAIVGTIKRRK